MLFILHRVSIAEEIYMMQWALLLYLYYILLRLKRIGLLFFMFILCILI